MPVSEFLPTIKKAVEHIEAARALIAKGPLDYYLKKLCEHSEALLTRFSPIKAGGRAVIVRKVNCKGGWAASERDLSVGASGVVAGVDYQGGQFWFEFVPDQQWWKDDDGKWHEKERLHSYLLSEQFLSSVNA